MCLPEQLPPPTTQLANQRYVLQLLAASLLFVGFFAILANHGYDVLILIIYALILYQGWSQFDYFSVLMFFMMAAYQGILTYVNIIGLIQYRDKISSQNSTLVLYTLSKFLYYPVAMIFSHEAYKSFKQYVYFNSSPLSFGNYQMMPMPTNRMQENYNQPARNEQNHAQRGFQAFQGQGTVIG